MYFMNQPTWNTGKCVESGKSIIRKKGFPMMYAYGLPDYQENEKKHYGANEVLDIAWNNIDKYKRWFK